MEAAQSLSPYRIIFCLASISLNALTSGSIYLYTLYISYLVDLSGSQQGLIAGLGTLAMYISAFPLGFLVDSRGPGASSFLAAILFLIGYGSMYYISVQVDTSDSFIPLCIAFACVGTATTASYFSALITVSKSAPTRYSGLAIGLTSSMFGLSPAFLSLFLPYFSNQSQELDARKWILFLALSLFAVNVTSTFGLFMPVVAAEEPEFHPDAIETTALLAIDTKPVSIVATPLRTLLARPSFWIFGLTLVLSTGPCEAVFVHIGSIIDSLLAKAQGEDNISISNTLARLIVGASSDWLSRPTTPSLGRTRPHFSRVAFLALVCFTSATVFFYSGAGLSVDGLWILSVGIGSMYGGFFSLIPAIIRGIYGVRDFGRNYGVFSWFSAFSALLFTPLFGTLSDRIASSQGREICAGAGCYSSAFYVSSVSSTLAAFLCIYLLTTTWNGRV